MNYKKKYKRQRERNKSLMDRIDDLKLEISEMNNTKSESMERIQNLIDELETIVRNAKGNESAIKEALKSKGASENINLESLGITKGKRNFKERITRKPNKFIYEKPTEQKGSSF